MDSANENFTYPWTVNSSIHLQLHELVFSPIHVIQHDPKHDCIYLFTLSSLIDCFTLIQENVNFTISTIE